MLKTNRGTIQTWLPTIAGIIIVLLIGGGIFAWQYFRIAKEEVKAPEEIPPKEVVKDETADWKTYSNEKYMFQMKHPVDWYVDEDSRLGGGIPEEGEVQFAFTSPDFTLDAGMSFVFSVKPTPFKDNQEFLLWRRGLDESNPYTKDKWTTKEINFFNIGQAVEWDTQSMKKIYVVRFPYLFEFYDYRIDSELSKIMSTFRFIE